MRGARHRGPRALPGRRPERRPHRHGAAKARSAAGHLPEFEALAIVGCGGALDDRLRPGDLFVATEVRGASGTVRCRSAEPLAGLLERTTGATVHRGPLVTVDHMVTGSERASLAATGALVADMESAELAAAAGERPFAVVRAIVDTPGRPLVSPATIPGGTAALRRLRTVGPALREWAGAAARAASSSPVPGRSAPGWSGRSRSWNARSPCTGRPSTCASRSSTTPMWWTT
ncbi:phosphorylase family protein [Actinomadura madurae]|uniref:phosphorylase family protein n=1 Tax=Actinomadura madurae TaxID=1993 RepID=UPI0020D1F6A0|nr:hypothetical protein [Actinomadura madurae]MCQ0005710.1 hypothetical protein [Actinomadura madurae]